MIKKIGITDEEIYELREQGMSYQEVAKYFSKLSYTPEYDAENIIEKYEKYPSIDYERMKNELHLIKIKEGLSFMRGYEEREEKTEEKDLTFLDKLKRVYKINCVMSNFGIKITM